MESLDKNMKDKTHWVIVTDLDGTLLDHHTYSFSAAQATLEKLEQHNIPVIINSSKTASEIEQLRTILNNKHPFIVENGSGIIIPKKYFSQQPDEAANWKSYWEIILGKPRSQLIDSLKSIPKEIQHCYDSFHESSLENIMHMTGLSEEEARHSNDRRYTEPLKWLGTTKQRQDFFWHLHKQHIHHTEGGRFIHLMGHTNKGSATSWLTRYYQDEYKHPVKVIALGDGNNDVDMLKAADIAVVIRSPVNEPPSFDHHCKIISDSTGPTGWSECIESIFFKHAELQD
jgi:mannosyl-3-phosphoglycerate phosphatase family protein